MNGDQQKQLAAQTAIKYIGAEAVVGVGTGTTVDFFIEQLAEIKGKIECAIASSKRTAEKLKAYSIPLQTLNAVNSLDIYIDGADEITRHLHCIKGGGAALTGEKILAQTAKKFICIANESKLVNMLGAFPVPVEVIPMARSAVARQLVKMGGDPIYRSGVVTDYGNVILDVHNLEIIDPMEWESELNQIPGVVTNGIFARRPVDKLVLGTKSGIKIFE